MGRRHIEVVEGLDCEVVGVFDSNVEVFDIAIKEDLISREKCFEDVGLMLSSLKPDGVVIASTAPSHFEYSILASNLGVKYVLCEKPMASSVEQCREIIKTCERNKTRYAVNHQMRFMDQYTIVKDLIKSEGFGSLRAVNVVASNFGLAMNGSHYFEMFRYMTDETISNVQFWRDEEKVPNPRGAQYEDFSGQIRAVSASGIRFQVEIGGDIGHGVQVVYSCRNGQIYVDELGGYLRATLRENEYISFPTTRYGMPARIIEKTIDPASVIGPSQAVLRALLNDENFPNCYDGLHTVQALVACNESVTGERVYLDKLSNEAKVYPWA